jgi:hypothetical protein
MTGGGFLGTVGGMRLLAVLGLMFFTSSCKTIEARAEAPKPTLTEQPLELRSQTLTSCTVRLTFTVEAAGAPLTVERAEYALVVDGVASPPVTQALNATLAAFERRDFTLEQPFTFVTSEAGLKALDARGGALLMALRGALVTSAGPLELARSKEVRTPRLPHLRLLEYEAGRFSPTEVQVIFHLGVVNPNPFDITLSWLDYTAALGGRVVSKGAVGAGERVGAASTGVFDVTALLDEASHGAEALALVKGLAIPWELTGLLRTQVSTELLQTHGTVKLTAVK